MAAQSSWNHRAKVKIPQLQILTDQQMLKIINKSRLIETEFAGTHSQSIIMKLVMISLGLENMHGWS